MKLKCYLLKADEPTVNGRVYPRKTLEKAIEKFKKQKTPHIGTIGTSAESPWFTIDKSSHEIKDLWLDEDGYMEAEVKLLDTYYGNFLKNFNNSLLKLSPIFIATVSEDLVVDIEYIERINIIIS